MALVLSLGLHWTLVQSAAWVSMVVTYSKDATIGEALEKTFDGAHPCPLCKMVDAGARSDRDNKSKQSKAGAIKKIEMALVVVETLVLPKPAVPECPVTADRAVKRSEVPPVPPPRVA
ncbi:MAG: hypothetical protein K1X78_01785 [Verrucomicrobiaceae bacterium]|nr:hypothetical protein [Verrucomicrobiaceae bacterium]